MKLKKATDYAFVILAYLASIPEGKSISSKEVAKTCKVPERFLANIVHSLSRAEIIESRKGMYGGISLARESSRITLREVIESIEGEIGLVDCLKTRDKCKIEKECAVKRFWNNLNEKILAPLNNTTLEDFMNYTKTKEDKKT